MALQQTSLNLQVTLGGEGAQFSEGGNTTSLSGYRMTATIAKNGIPSMNTAQIAVYGLDESTMNQLTRVGLIPTAVRNNVVALTAGIGDDNPALVFSGVIMDAWADYDGSPDVLFNITAATGYLQNLKPVLPSSYPGSTDVAVILKSLAGQMGYAFQNDGVEGVFLSSPYLPGTARAQAMAAAGAADIFMVLDDDPTQTSAGTMTIFPKNGSRNTPVPLVSPDTGMVGYPSYVGPGLIRVKTEFNPSIRFGGNIKIDSPLKAANGQWRVVQLTHSLSCQEPDGDWFTDVVGNLQLASSQ